MVAKTTSKRVLMFMMAFLFLFNFLSSVTIVSADDLWKDFDVDVSGTGEDTKVTVNAGGGAEDSWKRFIGKYKGVITGISAVGAITMVVLFIIQFLRLGASAGNPSARSQALTGCLWTGIAAALLGAAAFITGFFYKAI